MDSKLMLEFEELEGLADQQKDDHENLIDDNDDDDANFKPQAASALSSADIYFEVSAVHSKYNYFLMPLCISAIAIVENIPH